MIMSRLRVLVLSQGDEKRKKPALPNQNQVDPSPVVDEQMRERSNPRHHGLNLDIIDLQGLKQEAGMQALLLHLDLPSHCQESLDHQQQ